MKKKVKLTEEERIILKNVDKEYKYIVRDKSNDIYVFSHIPAKLEDIWEPISYGDYYNNFSRLTVFNHLFQFIKWEDEEPYLISDLLKEKKEIKE